MATYSQDTTKKLNAYLQTILNDLKKASYEKKLDFWVLHELDEFLTESYRNTTEVSHFESGWLVLNDKKNIDHI